MKIQFTKTVPKLHIARELFMMQVFVGNFAGLNKLLKKKKNQPPLSIVYTY